MRSFRLLLSRLRRSGDRETGKPTDSGALAGRDAVLIFLHIGKAGGSTLHSILERQYQSMGHFVTVGGPENRDEERYRALPEDEKARIRVFRGHLNFGVDALLGRLPATYVTMLREPVDRIVSHYYYLKRDVNHFLHRRCALENWSLGEFIDKNPENDNGQTRALAGVLDVYSFFKKGQPLIPLGACSDRILQIAKKNLRQCAVVGMTERFDESLIAMRRALGWQEPPLYIKQNVTVDRPGTRDVEADVLELIKKHNALDSELYKEAAGLLDQQIDRQGAAFRKELELFGALNTLYQNGQERDDEFQRLMADFEALRDGREPWGAAGWGTA